MPQIPASHRDLLDGPVGILTTLGSDGRPHTTALWFLIDDDGQVKISLNSSRQKTKNLLRRPEATFFVIDPANPYRTIEIRANAEVTPDTDKSFAARIGAKYGADLNQMDKPGESRVVVTLHPVKVNTYGG